MAAPIAMFWGDDDFLVDRDIRAYATALAGDGGLALERWDLLGQRNAASVQLADLRERLGTPVMFGGGTLAVVSNPGALVAAAGGRAAVTTAMAEIAPGNALVIVDIPNPKRRNEPSQRALATAVQKAGGRVREIRAPRAGALTGWIVAEARTSGIAITNDAAGALAARIAGAVDAADVDHRYHSRRAVMELEKLALRRPDGPITAEDVVELVADATPATVFGFVDAVADRRGRRAAELLGPLLDVTPEPVIIVTLHRRIRELLEIRDRRAEGQDRPAVVAAMRLHPYRAEVLERQAGAWSMDELGAALGGLVALDALSKGVPRSVPPSRRRLAITMWVVEHAAAGRPAA